MPIRSKWFVFGVSPLASIRAERWRTRLVVSLVAFGLNGIATPGNTQELRPSSRGGATSGALQDTKQKPGKDRILTPVTITLRNVELAEALESVAKQAGLRIAFGEYVTRSNKRVSLDVKKTPAETAIAMILQGTGLQYRKAGADEIVIEPHVIADSVKKQTISGIVLDSVTKGGIAGVTVTVVGTTLSAVTQERGGFTIHDVPAGTYSLSVKSLGYRTQTIPLVVRPERMGTITIALRQTATSLSEVVTTATGQQRRAEVGNDIVKLDAGEILERAPARSVSDMLRYAQVPGVEVLTASGDPGAPTRIRMRGIGSIQQNADPAIIVDGVWVNSDMSSKNIENMAGAGGGYTKVRAYASSPLDEIDPSAIESIEILRGPSAASLYGQEAANGVIVITTKRGKPGQTSWSYGFSRDWDSQVRSKFGQWVSYGTLAGGGVFQGCDLVPHYSLVCRQDSVVNLNQFGSLLDETGPAENFRHNIAVRGGSGNVTYSLSASYLDQLGTARTVPADLIKLRKLQIPYDAELVQPTRQKVMYLNSSFGFAPNKNLNFDISVNASNTDGRQNALNIDIQGAFLGHADTIAVVDHRDAGVSINRGGSKNLSIQSALRARYLPASWWNASAQIGLDKGEREDYSKVDSRRCEYGDCSPITARDGLQRARQSTNVMTGRLSASGVITTRFDRFVSLRPSIGLDFKHNSQEMVSLRLTDPPFGADGASGNGAGTIQSRTIVTAGYYLNTTVRVLDRMNFDLGWRQDAGSVIRNALGSRYPKLASSWLVSDEGFFPKTPWVTQFRLRGAMGYAAVHPNVADLYGSYTYGRAWLNGGEAVIANLQTIGNNELLPERSLEFEGGFDMDLINDRVELVFTLAHKVLRNAIVSRRLPTSAGVGEASQRNENVARVDNRSMELSINTRIIDNEAMSLTVGTAMSNVNNVIKKLGDRVTVFSNTSTTRLVEGYQIGSVWKQPILGYGDADNNGYIDKSEVLFGDTTVYMGWNTPKFSASYRASLSILRRSLTFSMSVSQRGPRIQNQTYRDNIGEVVLGSPLEAQALARANVIMRTGTAMRVSEIRLMSGAINYNLPSSVTRRLNAKLIALSLQGSNLGLWTNYSGRDPLVNSTPVGNAISDDGFTLPIPRRYALNVRVEL